MALIHEERTTDYVAIERVLIDAFARAEHASGREHLIVDSLRRDDALTLAVVAEQDHTILGHVAFSPVRIDGRSCGWHGLGPVAVRPSHQARGIGTALIREGLARLRQSGAAGCVVLGAPAFYSRFGFAGTPTLRFDAAPPEYFMALSLSGSRPAGCVTYHEAFAGFG